MAWTTVPQAVANTPATSSWANALLANLNETAAAKATVAGSIFVGTGLHTLAERIPAETLETAFESTSSTTYTNLTTTGPTVVATTGTKVLVGVTSDLHNSAVHGITYMSFAVSGATTRAADDDYCVAARTEVTGGNITARCSAFRLLTGLTSGSNTFQGKYRVSAGTGNFNERSLLVIPL